YDMRGAEAAFDKAVASAGSQSAGAGLQLGERPRSALTARLANLKGIFSLVSGKAGAQNNRGLARVLLGRVEDGSDDIDQAAVAAGDWPVPWVNGAVAALRLENNAQALESARRAVTLGERSATALAVLAEAELSVNQLDQA